MTVEIADKPFSLCLATGSEKLSTHQPFLWHLASLLSGLASSFECSGWLCRHSSCKNITNEAVTPALQGPAPNCTDRRRQYSRQTSLRGFRWPCTQSHPGWKGRVLHEWLHKKPTWWNWKLYRNQGKYNPSFACYNSRHTQFSVNLKYLPRLLYH